MNGPHRFKGTPPVNRTNDTWWNDGTFNNFYNNLKSFFKRCGCLWLTMSECLHLFGKDITESLSSVSVATLNNCCFMFTVLCLFPGFITCQREREGFVPSELGHREPGQCGFILQPHSLWVGTVRIKCTQLECMHETFCKFMNIH